MNEIVTEDCEGCRTPLQMTRVSVTRYAALSPVTRCLYCGVGFIFSCQMACFALALISEMIVDRLQIIIIP